MSVHVSVLINAPIAEVWAEAAAFESHVEWMADAESIEFLTDEREGPGTTMSVVTKVGPLNTVDVIEVTEVQAPHRIAVVHRGAVSGTGEFRLVERGPLKTEFVWQETLRFPWYFGGPLGARVASPILAAVWRRNLRRLKLRIEGTLG